MSTRRSRLTTITRGYGFQARRCAAPQNDG